ncbi:MAG TPA: histidine phosphatase family protein, partial [Atribacterota bacterium]|nr:histidine phosphatase family protein [Atribacterota bacterium]
PHLPLPGGESMSDFEKRVLSGLEKVISEYDNNNECETIAIVCHGGVTRIIIGKALNIPLDKIWFIKQDSTNLNILHYYKEDIYFVETINDINHLNANPISIEKGCID